MSALAALMRQQHGVITRIQARELGELTDRQIDGKLARGDWAIVRRGVLRAAAAPVTWESDLLAAVLASGGVASHRAAAALWRLGVWSAPEPEVTVPVSRSRRSGPERQHRTTQWTTIDRTVHRGIPVTGIDRTILDCAGVSSYRTTERLAEDAIRRNMTSWMNLMECLRTHSRRGRNGCLTLRTLLDCCLGDQTIPLSDFSRRVVNLLVDGGVPRPEIEFRISSMDTGAFIMQTDLAWPTLKKAWELDGLRWHFGRTDVERDRRKRNMARAEGWAIQEILWSMYTDDPEELVLMAKKFLAA